MDGCPHVHEGRTGAQCSDEEFKKTGLCANFKKCLNVHKIDEKKFGSLKDARAKIPGASALQMALKYTQTMMLGECTLSEAKDQGLDEHTDAGEAGEMNGSTAPYDPYDMTDMRTVLTKDGDMSETDIETSSVQSGDLLKAIMLSGQAEPHEVMFGDNNTEGTAPYVLLMIDGGTFRHMIGSNAMQYMVNRRKVKRYPIKTAGGIIWLDSIADLRVPGHIFEGCMVNPMIDTSLLSQGMMAMTEGWEFWHGAKAGKRQEGYK